MNFKKYLVAVAVLVAVFVLVGTVSARVVVDKGDLYKRIIAHTEEEVNKAVSLDGPKNGKAEFIQDEIIVKFQGDKEPRVLKVPEGKVGEKVKEYKKKADVIYAEPNYIAYALMVPNDPYYKYQWHLDNPVYGGIGMEDAWNLSTGTGVTVAVVDTGIRKGTDLANTCFVAGHDYVNKDTDPTDDNGHGTHVAGTIAQSTNNALGTAGVAFNSCLMPVKVLDKTGAGTYANVALGIRYAADNGVEVINLSLGGTSADITLQDAVAYAYGKGVTVIAAAGNENSTSILYPAAYDDYVIAVGATQYDETKAPYSNYGPSLDLVAPGGNTNLDQNKDGYGDGVLQQTFQIIGRTISWGYYFFQGTSMASPHVAGVAALVISRGIATAPEEVRTVLQSSAEDLGAPGRDDIYGYGLIDATVALNSSPLPLPPPPEPPSEIAVFEDSFEISEWNGLWTEDKQNDWFRSTQRAVNGKYSAEVDGSASDAKLISIPINLQGKTNAKITFSWFIESSLDSGEYLAFDVSTDGGTIWVEKARLRGNVDPENIWHNLTIDLTSISNLQIQFRGKMSDAVEDANVDMVKVVAW